MAILCSHKFYHILWRGKMEGAINSKVCGIDKPSLKIPAELLGWNKINGRFRITLVRSIFPNGSLMFIYTLTYISYTSPLLFCLFFSLLDFSFFNGILK